MCSAPKARALRLFERGDVAPVELDGAGVDPIDPADDIQQGGFARPAAPDDGNGCAVSDGSADIVQHAMFATAFPEAAREILEEEHSACPQFDCRLAYQDRPAGRQIEAFAPGSKRIGLVTPMRPSSLRSASPSSFA